MKTANGTRYVMKNFKGEDFAMFARDYDLDRADEMARLSKETSGKVSRKASAKASFIRAWFDWEAAK